MSNAILRTRKWKLQRKKMAARARATHTRAFIAAPTAPASLVSAFALFTSTTSAPSLTICDEPAAATKTSLVTKPKKPKKPKYFTFSQDHIEKSKERELLVALRNSEDAVIHYAAKNERIIRQCNKLISQCNESITDSVECLKIANPSMAPYFYPSSHDESIQQHNRGLIKEIAQRINDRIQKQLELTKEDRKSHSIIHSLIEINTVIKSLGKLVASNLKVKGIFLRCPLEIQDEIGKQIELANTLISHGRDYTLKHSVMN